MLLSSSLQFYFLELMLLLVLGIDVKMVVLGWCQLMLVRWKSVDVTERIFGIDGPSKSNVKVTVGFVWDFIKHV